jgi:enoyl-CoA hydratase
MYQTLLTDLTDQILTVTINRPDKLNALNRQVMDELKSVVEEIYRNPGVHSAIFTGSGNKAFAAGADITEFLNLNQEQATALSHKGQEIFFGIENAPKPVIAAVNGFALGGGCELALACHLRTCSTTARFGQPEVNLGLVPGYGATQRLPLLVGRGKAMEWMMTGNLISAEEALRHGLVNLTAPPEELLSKTRGILLSIQSKAPLAIKALIRCVNQAGMGGMRGFELEQTEFGACAATQDMQEGTNAFLEKRKPLFRGV